MAPRHRVIKPAKSRSAGLQDLAARHVLPKLPSLYQKTQGRAFGAQVFREWLRSEKGLEHYKLPSVQQVGRLLNSILQTSTATQRASRTAGEAEGSRRIWSRKGWDYIDPEGWPGVSNVKGHAIKKRGSSQWITWHEYGQVFQVHKDTSRSRAGFIVTCTDAYKSLGSIVAKSNIKVQTDTSQATFRDVVTFDPHRGNVGKVAPQWSLIYLHSFSQKGSEYLEFPHYFGISEAAVRVVIPTAPQLEQACFKDWMVWSRSAWRIVNAYAMQISLSLFFFVIYM
jgi:hypothetical protein